MDTLAAAAQADGKRATAWFALARLRLSVAEDGSAGLEALGKAIEAGFTDRAAASALLAEPVLAEREAVAKLFADKGLTGEPPAAAPTLTSASEGAKSVSTKAPTEQ